MKRFSITAIILIILIVACGLFYLEGSMPADPSSKQTQTFVIARGAAVNKIINNLEKEGLIRNRLVFYVIVKQLHIEDNIQAGSFRLSPSMSAREVAQALTKGSNDIWITVIEGLRKEEIARIVSAELGIPESEFNKAAVEGQLFPDTYLIPRGASLSQVLGIFKANFDKKYSAELRQRARRKGLSDNDVLTLASMVEREANSVGAKRQVASIMYKRYLKGWPLDIDATVQYALGYQEGANTWWKKNLTAADLKIPSLYNTYARPGLPPAPIASPGLDAIEAVIDADANTPYWFYISSKDGSRMYYAKTIEEHNANVEKHLR